MRFYHYLVSTEYRYDVKDPSTPLGMTERGTDCLTFHLIPLWEPTSAPSGHLLPKEGGRSPQAFPSRGNVSQTGGK